MIPTQLRQTLLLPNFLNRIDRHLLLYNPRLWSTKFHYVVYYGLLANIFLNLIVLAFVQPYMLSEFSSLLWVIFFTEMAAFAYWFYNQSLFNIERDYGHTHYAVGLIEMLIYILCTVIIFSGSLTMLATSLYKTAYQLGINEHTTCMQYYTEIAPFFTSNEQSRGLAEIERNYNIDLDPDKLHNFSEIMQDRGIVPRQLTGEFHSYFDRTPLERIIDPCLETKAFVTNYFDDSDYTNSTSIGYHSIVNTHTFFAIWGILLLVVIKHSDWRTFGFLMVYLLISIVVFFLFLILIGESLSFPLSRDEQLYYSLGTFTLFMLVQSMRLVGAKKYKPFPFLNFIVLPSWLVFSVLMISTSSFSITVNTTLALLGFFLIYLLFVLPQKRVLVYLNSLPKG